MVNILFPSCIPVQPLAALLNQRPAGRDRMHAQYAKAWISGESQAIPTLPSALPEVTHGEGSSKRTPGSGTDHHPSPCSSTYPDELQTSR